MVPTFASYPSFMGITDNQLENDIIIAGIPYDVGTSNRAGTRFGPCSVRLASRMLIDGVNPGNWKSPTNLNISDIGNLDIRLGDIEKSFKLIEDQCDKISNHLITIGGDHSITLPILRSLKRKKRKPLALIHFDAHIDTWPDTFGNKWGHGSVFYHAINENLVDPNKMIQIGIRSPVDKEIVDWTLDKGVTILSSLDCHNMAIGQIVNIIKTVVQDYETYLSFDIDVIDPSQAPGTGTPEIGGLWTWQIQSIIRKLFDINFCGMDLVEVSPSYGHAELTSLAGASIIFEYISLL